MSEKIWKAKNPDFRNYVLEKVKGQHFMRLIGFSLSKIDEGLVSGEMEIVQDHLQQHGFVHGGVSSTLLDIVMGFSAYTLVNKNQGVVTANLSIDYHYPAVGDRIIAEGRVDKMGSKMAFCSAKLYVSSKEGKSLVAQGRSIMAVIEGG